MPGNVLVVDDSSSMRNVICQTLGRAGYTTHEAANGLEALLKARDIKPLALIIADVNMPVMDGIKMAVQIRKTPGMSTVPLLMLTTETDARIKAQGRAAGANGWVVKPFEPTQLVEVVRKFAP
jgi:two-component system chemotaxis response regulator CheY